jgi:hypothetical protein
VSTAEETFTRVLADDPANAVALAHRGEVKMIRATMLAARAQFGPANEAMQSATADLDRAVSLAPDSLDVRLARGLAYSPFPPYYHKSSETRDDLEAATRHQGFAALPIAQKARAFQLLGIAYNNLAEGTKAAAAFRAAIDADATSTAAQDAKTRLAALEAAGIRDGAPYHPDRFPTIANGVGPLVAAASITFPGGRLADTPSWVSNVTTAIKGFRDCSACTRSQASIIQACSSSSRGGKTRPR